MDSTDFAPLFDPPLSEQRKKFILDTLRKHAAYIDWVVDLGCGTGALSRILVNSCLVSRISHVDVCEYDLNLALQSLEPNWMDSANLRERPLKLEFYHGDLSQYDERIQTVHAIVFSEVMAQRCFSLGRIEHLFPGTLEKIPKVLFEYYQPKLVIVSTPNADFNPNFPTYHPGYLRDEDHKFEWTQSEFEAWCTKVARMYGYEVEFDGIGIWSRDSGVYNGFATQFAIFRNPSRWTQVQKWPLDDLSISSTDGPWHRRAMIEYPWHKAQVPIPMIFDELLALLNEDNMLSLSEFWAQLTVRQCFRTLTVCKSFLEKAWQKLTWVDPHHDEILVELGELNGGIIHWHSKPQRQGNFSSTIS